MYTAVSSHDRLKMYLRVVVFKIKNFAMFLTQSRRISCASSLAMAATGIPTELKLIAFNNFKRTYGLGYTRDRRNERFMSTAANSTVGTC